MVLPQMDTDVLIREGSPAEQNQVEALVQTAYREFQPLFPEQVWQSWMDNIGETVHSPAGVIIVAESARKIQGVVKFYPDASQAGLGKWPRQAASMRILAVHPESRGKGYGTLLAEECVRRAQVLKIATIYLYTGTFMQAARHIYEKLGFSRAPEFDRDPGPIAYRLVL
jgi:ribosomal protein S18 acetylase RimI-like enzyme